MNRPYYNGDSVFGSDLVRFEPFYKIPFRSIDIETILEEYEIEEFPYEILRYLFNISIHSKSKFIFKDNCPREIKEFCLSFRDIEDNINEDKPFIESLIRLIIELDKISTFNAIESIIQSEQFNSTLVTNNIVVSKKEIAKDIQSYNKEKDYCHMNPVINKYSVSEDLEELFIKAKFDFKPRYIRQKKTIKINPKNAYKASCVDKVRPDFKIRLLMNKLKNKVVTKVERPEQALTLIADCSFSLQRHPTAFKVVQFYCYILLKKNLIDKLNYIEVSSKHSRIREFKDAKAFMEKVLIKNTLVRKGEYLYANKCKEVLANLKCENKKVLFFSDFEDEDLDAFNLPDSWLITSKLVYKGKEIKNLIKI